MNNFLKKATIFIFLAFMSLISNNLSTAPSISINIKTEIFIENSVVQNSTIIDNRGINQGTIIVGSDTLSMISLGSERY